MCGIRKDLGKFRVDAFNFSIVISDNDRRLDVMRHLFQHFSFFWERCFSRIEIIFFYGLSRFFLVSEGKES
jgi:hypothetical protein